ncbi:MAG: ATP:cob(I)alamin adenosyltransferase, partial [Rhodospirillaceae bacterium]|nr:ATP:cob(I)alamin adenosyltransferase [Rhodospirillaceae bacterium]
MVKLTKIYTRGGDEGYTSLGNGERVPKYSHRPVAYGA